MVATIEGFHCVICTVLQIFERYLKKRFADHPFDVESKLLDSVADEVVLTIPELIEGYKLRPIIGPPKVIQ